MYSVQCELLCSVGVFYVQCAVLKCEVQCWRRYLASVMTLISARGDKDRGDTPARKGEFDNNAEYCHKCVWINVSKIQLNNQTSKGLLKTMILWVGGFVRDKILCLSIFKACIYRRPKAPKSI